MKRAVFLDRDGVINRSRMNNGVPKPPTSIEDVEIIDGVLEAIKTLQAHNFIPVVVTNQPDVSRGAITVEQVSRVNAHIGEIAGIQYFYVCFHDDTDICECRKPKPGLILRAASELKLTINQSFMVGDRWRDISAGQAAGCKNFFIDYSYLEKQPEMPYIKVASLLEAVKLITGQNHETN
jgi:D-glycero-D-manno-heptose 1,7-bisphosphate phosphatase